MKYVLDASVCVKWYVPEIYEQEATRLLQGGHTFHAPELILPELSSIIWKKVRKAEITPAEGHQIVDSFLKTRLTLHSHKQLTKSAYLGAESTGLTVYDWSYMALAVGLSCEFVTADQSFYRGLETTPLKKNLLWIGDV